MRIETAGGAGFGPAHERDPEAVLRDVREGKVTRDRARETYGVAIKRGEWAVDLAETRRLRRSPGR